MKAKWMSVWLVNIYDVWCNVVTLTFISFYVCLFELSFEKLQNDDNDNSDNERLFFLGDWA